MRKIYSFSLLPKRITGVSVMFLLFVFGLPLCAQNQKEIQFPGTDLFLTPPEHFEMSINENGESFLFHPGTNGVIQAVSRDDIQWTELKKLYDENYFKSHHLNLLMSQDQELTDGTPAMVFICSAKYPDKSDAASTDYKVMIFTGGKDDKTFFVIARFPEIADELLTNPIMNTFFSVHR
jgi:hypothetical protein